MTEVLKIKHDVEHFQQKHSWDCGLACVIMVLGPDDRKQLLDNLTQICQEEAFGKSTWTIDLCYLLKRFNKRFVYTTVTLGVDPGYNKQGFYSRILDQDGSRVAKRFEEAEAKGITVLQQSKTANDIIDHLSHHGPCIVLTDANVYANDGLLNCCYGGAEKLVCSKSSYQGHYILVVGFDLEREVVIYRNPSTKDKECEITFSRFERARASYGTDEDIIFLFKNSADIGSGGDVAGVTAKAS